MAGNTKFLGFGAGNQITLERWLQKVTVDLPGSAIEVLREACYDKLPKQPNEQNPRRGVAYDEQRGTVSLECSPEEAEILSKYLKNSENPWSQPEDPQILQWSQGLDLAVEDHRRYIDPTGEPGVEE